LVNTILFLSAIRRVMPPRPFAPDSAFARLLIKTWKTQPVPATTGAPSKWTPEALEAKALNAYSILHDRRIPQATAAELNAFYVRTCPAGAEDPDGPVLQNFVPPPVHSPQNSLNHRYGFNDGPPIPKIDLLSAVRFTGAYVEWANGRSWPYLDSTLRKSFEGTKSTPKADQHMWKWLVDQKGRYDHQSCLASNAALARDMAELVDVVNGHRLSQGRSQWSAGFTEVEAHRRCVGQENRPELAESWIAPLGVSYGVHQIFLIFKFPAKEAQFLCRPHHLDAGFYREHFPSPVHEHRPWQGHPMCIASGVNFDSAPLIREFVHPPVKFSIEHLHAIAVTESDSDMVHIPAHRHTHWKRLEKRYQSCSLDQRLFSADTGTIRCDIAKCGCAESECRQFA
jgi:hypothetical protein